MRVLGGEFLRVVFRVLMGLYLYKIKLIMKGYLIKERKELKGKGEYCLSKFLILFDLVLILVMIVFVLLVLINLFVFVIGFFFF